MTHDSLLKAARQLARTDRGRNAMRRLLEWLDDDGLALDAPNKEAILTLLAGAWGSYAMTARDEMRDALDDARRKDNALQRAGLAPSP
jgi:predicted component of type VI protein secretion system